jgi:hypothetical protein
MKYSRRNFIKNLASVPFLAAFVPQRGFWPGKGREIKTAQLKDFKKIDIHTHISSDAHYLREVMDDWNLKMFTICNEGLKSDRLEAQRKAAVEISEEWPRYYAWCTTFELNGFDTPGWTDRVLTVLEDDFSHGALGVKVWKEIGMQLKDKKGNFIQIDDPIFEPVLDYIQRKKKTLFSHIGDPPDYWLSTGADGKPDSWYKEGNGVWNRIGEFRGEIFYETLMQARDRVLDRYPDLKIVGCHMGNMSFDVDQLAIRLERFPNYAVETSFTIPYLMGQAREKIRNFFLKYQDRILYGSDISGGLVATPFLVDMSKIDARWAPDEIHPLKQDLVDQYERDFNYFATDQEFDRKNNKVRGLNLPDDVLQKFYFDNAVSWVPGVEKYF